MKKNSSVLFVIFLCLFMGGIALHVFGREMCTRDTEDYMEPQPELFAPEEIAAVLYDAELRQLYVCYDNASYVNVYDESGKFLWAVSTPYLRNSHFALQDGRLFIYNSWDAYVYDSHSGVFIDCIDSEELLFESEGETGSTDKFYFDAYQVYRSYPDGSTETVITRPLWFLCFNSAICVTIILLGAAGICVTVFLYLKKEYDRAKDKVKFNERKAEVSFKYFRITTIVHLVYTVLDIASGFFGAFLCIGMVPLVIHYIIKNAILWNMLDSMHLTDDEKAVLDFWKVADCFSLIVAFFSMFVAISISG